MKSLLEIQQDIRSLEHSINDITDTIKEISSDIEDLRNANQNTDIDYSKIELLSKLITFGKHPIDKLDDGRACQVYLEMLLNIVRLDPDEELSLNRLMFIQWIQKESRINLTLEDLFKDSYKIDTNAYHEMVDVIPTKYKEFFVVDALIVANIGGTANTEINEYIVGLVTTFGITKERLRILSFVARTVLCQKVQRMEKEEMDEFQKCAKAYKHYIKADILKNGILSLRQLVVEIPDDDCKNFKWKVKQGQAVRKDDIIAIYSKATKIRGFSHSTNYKTEEIKAPSTGTIFQFRDNCINYGVIAHETDNKDSIKAWVKERR